MASIELPQYLAYLPLGPSSSWISIAAEMKVETSPESFSSVGIQLRLLLSSEPRRFPIALLFYFVTSAFMRSTRNVDRKDLCFSVFMYLPSGRHAGFKGEEAVILNQASVRLSAMSSTTRRSLRIVLPEVYTHETVYTSLSRASFLVEWACRRGRDLPTETPRQHESARFILERQYKLSQRQPIMFLDWLYMIFRRS